MYGPLLFAAAVGLFILVAFVAIWRLAGKRDPVDERLRELDASEGDFTSLDVTSGAGRRLPWSGTNRMLAAVGLGPKLSISLTQADVPLTAAEFALIMMACFLVGAFIGSLRFGLIGGILIGALVTPSPMLVLNFRRQRRQRAFTAQIPEILTLLVGALRAGYGVGQAMGVIVNQLAPPASIEFGRVMRAVGLGLPLPRALNDMAARAGSDEVGMIVTAINVQHETGGNLAQTLETIGDTVRDRLRVKGEIQALTSQQRLTGYILAALPLGLAALLSILNPSYMRVLFEPGFMRFILVGAGVMQLAGFLVIGKIVDIEV